MGVPGRDVSSRVVLDAPSNLGLRPPAPGVEPGVRHMPAALRRHRLVERLQATDAGVVPAPPYGFDLDPAVGVRNWQAIAAYAVSLADALTPLLAAGQRPLLLGGDCSIALGVQLALRRRGDFGVIYLDGHDDLQRPAISRTGGAAGMDVALMLGYGPDALSNLEGRRPLLRPEGLALLGMRGGWLEDPEMTRLRQHRVGLARSLAGLRRHGPRESAGTALSALAAARMDGFWVHLDADVLDHATMPAVDSPRPDGLTYDELVPLLRAFVTVTGCVGLTVTIYDPTLDPTGEVGAGLATALAAALGPG